MSKKQLIMIIWATPSIKRQYLENKKLLKRLRTKRNQIEVEMEIELEELNMTEYHKLKEEYIAIAGHIQRLDEKETEYIKIALDEFRK